MTQYFAIHPDNPQLRLIRQAAEILRNGAVIAYPTDSGYALGCRLDDKDAVARLRRIRELDDDHLLTLMCRDLSELARYARVDNVQFRLLKNNTPGSYTFILEATKEVPRRIQHARRNTIGLRIPDHPVALALLQELDEPLLSASLIMPGETEVLSEGDAVRDRLQRQVELVIDGGGAGIDPTTVVDLTGAAPVLLRRGKGSPADLGIEE